MKGGKEGVMKRWGMLSITGSLQREGQSLKMYTGESKTNRIFYAVCCNVALQQCRRADGGNVIFNRPPSSSAWGCSSLTTFLSLELQFMADIPESLESENSFPDIIHSFLTHLGFTVLQVLKCLWLWNPLGSNIHPERDEAV